MNNIKNGLGRSDIFIKDRKNRRAVVIETKTSALDALLQIEEKQYARKAEHSGFKRVVRLGMAFWKKRCLVERG